MDGRVRRRRDIRNDQPGNGIGMIERNLHRGLATHRMSQQQSRHRVELAQCLHDIVGHAGVAHVGIMRTAPVVAQVQGYAAPVLGKLALYRTEVACGTEQTMQQDKRGTPLTHLYRIQFHRRDPGHAAHATPNMISPDPARRSAVIGSPSSRFERTMLTAGVVRNPTDETTAGNAAVARITHSVPNGPAIRPIYASAVHDCTLGPIVPSGSCHATSGASISALIAKHQGSNWNNVSRGRVARVTMIATDQDSDAPSRKPLPIRMLRDV